MEKLFFRDDYYLSSLDVSTFKTSKMKSMKSMFDSCNSLKVLDVSHFDTSNVTVMDSLFRNCVQAKIINISGWNTSKTYKMENMFAGCKSVRELNLSSFDTSRVYSLYNMFDACESLTILDLSNFDTSNVRDIRWMFAYTNLNEIKGLESWNIPKVINLSYTFYKSTIPEIHLPRIQNIYDMNNAFSHNPNLKTIDLSNLTFDSGVDWVDSFRNCSKLESIFVSKDFRNVATIRYNTFLGCNLLVGGSGTKYDPTFIDSTGARIDGGVSNPGYFTAISHKIVKSGSMVNIEGSDYIVLDKKNTDKYLVISKEAVGDPIYFQTSERTDGQNMSTYEHSDVDNYLESTWYPSLSTNMKNAIQSTKIKQCSYSGYNSPETKEDQGYNGQSYNEISRHVFLPGVDDLSTLVNLKDNNSIITFLGGKDIWLRDSHRSNPLYVVELYYYEGLLGYAGANHVTNWIRPTFVIDLSKVNYTVTGSVNYK